MTQQVITVAAPAKINWTLDVYDRYPPGHPQHGFSKLRSVMQLLDLEDLVEVGYRPGKGTITVAADEPSVPQTSRGNAEENICFRVLKLLQEHFAIFRTYDFDVRLEKRIPLAGGLGGSSTDGSAVLSALLSAFAIPLEESERLALAARVGSDRPFFSLRRSLALVSGRGESVVALPPRSEVVHLLLINPGVPLHVATVFRSLHEHRARTGSRSGEFTDRFLAKLSGRSLLDALSCAGNDLAEAPAVREILPEYENLCSLLHAAGCPAALLSGSGPTVFAGGRSADHIAMVAEQVRERFPQMNLLTTTTRTTELTN
ncbi:MAG: hypothetical protein KDD44_05570 [Bdellovibrionales bacterium]|nr:hypothetical protein [Bdellovibrionales bacterium]